MMLTSGLDITLSGSKPLVTIFDLSETPAEIWHPLSVHSKILTGRFAGKEQSSKSVSLTFEDLFPQVSGLVHSQPCTEVHLFFSGRHSQQSSWILQAPPT